MVPWLLFERSLYLCLYLSVVFVLEPARGALQARGIHCEMSMPRVLFTV